MCIRDRHCFFRCQYGSFINKQDTVQMIQLVLYSDRQNAVAGKLHTFAFTVKKLTFNIFGAFYFAFKIRHRQTAFAADNGTFPFGDNRIDKLDQAFANVDNYYSSGNTYLRRCQAYACLLYTSKKEISDLTVPLYRT